MFAFLRSPLATLLPASSPSAQRSLFAAVLAALLFAAPLARAQEQEPDQAGPNADPPERVARLSLVQGNVSLQPAGVNQFSQAENNYPLSTGDRLFTDNGAQSELQSSALAVRMAAAADVTLTGLTDQLAQFGLAQGSMRVRTWQLDPNAVVEIDTPNGTVTILRAGDVRVDTYPQDDTTVVTVNSGEAQATGPNLSQMLTGGQSLKLTGSNPVYAERVQLLPPDDLDRFSQDRDRMEQSARTRQQQYVNPDMIGYSDLEQYGDWTPEPEYGAVWYPRGVAVGWTPYHYGHWAWVAPWGWTWVESEPWGFAPFHYGRWAVFGGRWGWVPGPTIIRPVYSPALVAFVGGPGFSISVAIGSRPSGLCAWFPLGPREPYVPWYHASPAYVNRVNVTNIYNRNVTEVRNVYNNRTTNVYVNNTTINKITYVNRNIATTAVPQQSFAAGRPVASSAVRVDQNQLQRAQVLPHPMVTPAPQITSRAPARAVPPNLARPELQTRQGLAQAVPGAQARPVPERPLPPQQQPTQQAGRPQINNNPPAQYGRYDANPNRTQNPQPAPSASQPIQQANRPAPATAVQPQQPTRPISPATGQPQLGRPMPGAAVNQPSAAVNQPGAAANQPGAAGYQNRGQQPQLPTQYRTTAPPVAPRPPDQPRPLINHAEPPPPQPSFNQQREVMQRTDPGRPLGPRQVDNIRNGAPAGPHQQAEPIPHPQGRPAPPPQQQQQRDQRDQNNKRPNDR